MMTTTEAFRGGDERAFDRVVRRHRRELHAHCRRMVGSAADAEELVQETFLRAWRRRATYAGRASVRSWLYRIATNVCLDELGRARPRVVPEAEAGAGHGGADGGDTPHTAAVAKETLELAFLAAVRHLPPKQRAVLVLRDVAGWPAADVARALGESVPAVNSALQRARAACRELLPRERDAWGAPAPSRAQRALLQRYLRALEADDGVAVACAARDDASSTRRGCQSTPDRRWCSGGRAPTVAA